jgi:hypothetical protein
MHHTVKRRSITPGGFSYNSCSQIALIVASGQWKCSFPTTSSTDLWTRFPMHLHYSIPVLACARELCSDINESLNGYEAGLVCGTVTYDSPVSKNTWVDTATLYFIQTFYFISFLPYMYHRLMFSYSAMSMNVLHKGAMHTRKMDFLKFEILHWTSFAG